MLAAVRPRLPIRVFLVLLAVMLLAPVLLFSGLVLARFSASERSRYHERTLEAAHRAASALDRDIAGVEVALQMLANSTQIDSGDLRAFHDRMVEASHLLNASIVLRSLDSQQLLNTHEPWDARLPGGADRPGDRRVIETGQPTVSDLLKGQLTGEAVVNVTVPVIRHGRIVNLLNASVRPARFNEILAAQELPSGWPTAVIDRTDRVVARAPNPDSFVGGPATADLRQHATQAEGTWIGRNLDGKVVFAAYARSALSGFRVTVGAPEAELDARLRRPLLLLGLFGTGATAASVLFGLWLGRLVAGPLRRLAEAGGALGSGVPLPPVQTPILEIRGLAEVLGTASDDLHARARERDAVEDRLREVAATLAQRVIELRESEAQFRTFAQVMPIQVWTAPPDGLLDWFNERTYAYAGLARADLAGEGWTRIVHPDDLPSAAPAWAGSLATGEPYEAQFRIRRHDGAWRWHIVRATPIRAEGRIVRWIGTNTDIDDQKAAQADLASLNAQLERRVAERTAERDQVWRLSRDLLSIADTDGWLHSVNPAWHAVLDWTEEELKSTPLLDLVHPDDRDATTLAMEELRRGETVIGFVNRTRHRDGSYRWFSWNSVPANGLIYAIVRDVTAERHAAEMLSRTEEALRQSQKMEAVGQLTGGIAHDFNNLLTGIAGSLELAQTRVAQGRFGELDRYLIAAQGAASRAAALTHRLLAFSRRQTLDPKPIGANRLVAEMEDLIRRTVGPAITVEVVAAGGLWTTLCDPNQLENALLNLAINARDAMPQGGRLTIETVNAHLDRDAARARDVAPGQYVALCVTDTGTGMPADVAARAFDPFFTTKPLGQGTGLGLSMIYGFAKQSGGQARIYSEPGQGTTVKLYLPRHYGDRHDDAPDATGLPAAPKAGAGETVLVVDDEPTVRMLVGEVLAELGYAALEAGDAASGLRILQTDARVDLLVTDVGLPGGMNGRQLADAARQGRPDLRVLFITGYAENAAIGNGLLAPGMQVITKPFAMQALATRIGAMIRIGDI